MKRSISLLVISALWLGATSQSSVLGQKRSAPPRGYPVLHAVTHVDLIEQYERKTREGESHDETKEELDLHYDLTQDFRVVEGEYGAGSFTLGSINPAVPGGSAHIVLSSSTGNHEVHESSKADSSGAVEQGGLTFISQSGPGIEEITALTVRFPNGCQTTGNMHSEPNACGPEDLDDVGAGAGSDHVFYAEHKAVLHHKETRPADLTEKDDFGSNDWYGGNAVGSVKTGYKIDFTGIKKFDDTPREGEHYDSFYDHAEKKLTVSIVVTPTGKLALNTRTPRVDASIFIAIDVAERPRIFAALTSYS